MEQNVSINVMDLIDTVQQPPKKILNLPEYLEMVIRQPELAESAHARIYRMIKSAGVETDDDGNITEWKFFKGHIFGLKKEIKAIMEYMRSAAAGGDTKRRVLMLMGPVATGKSTIANLLKKKLAEWTRTEAGAVYAIDGCPLLDDPLKLLGPEGRQRLQERFHIHVRGELCPVCRVRMETEWENNPANAPIVRVFFSEAARIGIGTFFPGDPKSQYIDELLGSVDLSKVGIYGGESDPRAYRFDGELQKGNRGIVEMGEAFKAKRELLLPLLNASQEQCIKVPRHGLIDVDTFILAHTNETEYRRFWNEQQNEALRDRFIPITIPYNLKVSDEEKIYEKIVKESGLRAHVAPDTLRTAAMFAVLTRLDSVDGLPLVDKARLYDGEMLPGWNGRRIKEELLDHAHREGMEGISPRFVSNAIAKAMTRPDADCASAIDVMRALKEAIENAGTFEQKEREDLLIPLAETRKWFDQRLLKTVSRAFVHAFTDQAKAITQRYLTEIAAARSKERVKDAITDEWRDPDEKFMRAIEEQVGVSEPAKKEFRDEILFQVGQSAIGGKPFDMGSHPRLKDAVEKYLFSQVRPIMKTLVRIQAPDDEQKRKLDEVKEAMVQEGYCASCAASLLRYCGHLIND